MQVIIWTDVEGERMKIPCKNCICVAVCRHKNYFNLTQCSLLHKYIESYNKGTFVSLTLKYRYVMYNILKPTKWVVNKHGYFLDKNGNEVTREMYKTVEETRR